MIPYRWWARLDHWVHKHKMTGRFARWVCYRLDRAIGLTKKEARS